MNETAIRPDRRRFLAKVLHDLLCCGWRIENVPADGIVPNNGLLLILRVESNEARLRVFAYKVTGSSRERPHERRVEITTTYQSGLGRLPGYRDIVLGIDTYSGTYVGVDSRRLSMGGETHNASSFFDLEGLSVEPGNLLINPRAVASSLFPGGIELHAFFDRSRLSEYLLNQREIHSGQYAFGGMLNGPSTITEVSLPEEINSNKASGSAFILASLAKTRTPKVSAQLIAAVEKDDLEKVARRRKITPEELRKLLSVWDEIGALGEQAVLHEERKRLRKLGFREQAAKVERVSLRSVGEGYDIASFEDDGVRKRYIEVKATVGKGFVINMSRGELRAAKRHGEHYYIARVITVKREPHVFYFRNPFKLLRDELITRTALGWKIDLSPLLTKA